jgi:hypothetical protein
MVFLSKMDDYQKKTCDTNKNVTKMGVIIMGVYCTCMPCHAKNLNEAFKHNNFIIVPNCA